MLKRGLLAALALLGALGLSSTPVWAQVAVIDDCEGGTNQNKFLAYWYYYDDSADKGVSKVTNANVIGTGTKGENKYSYMPTAGQGYNGTYGAKMDYTMGATKPTCGTGCTYGQMVGIGTMLAPEGKVLDITGAAKITYWAKASAPMTVRVEVATSTVLDFAYHRVEHDITTAWAQYTINLLDQGIEFRQPDWTQTPVDFDPKKAEKIQWQVSKEYPANPNTGSLIIDNVEISPYEWIPPTACPTCIGAAGLWKATDGMLLSDFDSRTPNRNALGKYFYCYNDAAGRSVTDATQYSNIFGGVTEDATDPTTPLIAVEGNGQTANGAFIDFELGPTYTENANIIKPFVGIGTMLADNLLTEFYDAKAAGATGVYFDYKTTGDIDYIRLEVKANQDFGNVGIVHSVLLKGTGGQWKSAKVPFTVLSLPDWEEVAALPDKTLKLSALEKIQWAYQGQPGQKGSLAIDNIGLIGAAPISVMMPRKSADHARFSAVRMGDKLSVTFNTAAIGQPNRVELVSLQGKTVAQTKMTAQNLSSGRFEIPAAGLASGWYLVRLTEKSGSGATRGIGIPMCIAE